MPRLAGVDVSLTRAEFDKYAAPLLLIHGLWAREWVWYGPSSYLAHRGWNSYALPWSGAAGSWAEMLQLAQRAVDEIGSPIVLGHDLGALAALQLRRTCAAVALAPLPCGAGAATHPLARSWSARLARWRGGAIRPGDALSLRILGVPAEKLSAESSRWTGELAGIEMGEPEEGVPRLILGGTADACASAADFATLARRVGAEVELVGGGGHDLPYGTRWQSALDAAHRWLVRRLGDELLLLQGDEDLRDE